MDMEGENYTCIRRWGGREIERGRGRRGERVRESERE